MRDPQFRPDPSAPTRGSASVGALPPPKRERDSQPAAASASRRILGMRVDATRYDAVARTVVERARTDGGGMVCVATVHMVMEAFDDPGFRHLVNAADVVTPDGVPLVWALRLLGIPGAQRVYGPTLTDLLCRRAAALDVPVGFYGGTPAVLDALVARLGQRHPGLRVVSRMSPPFRPLTREEDHDVIEAIRDSGARILFVGLGCPKQESWMAAHVGSLSCVMVGVGAAFDFLAGTKPQAPDWMQSAGLEWFFRLLCEPRRLWRRYLVHNPRFVLGFALQLAGTWRGRP